jgi:IS5 family transposase
VFKGEEKTSKNGMKEKRRMLVDRSQGEDVFARVPQMAHRLDPVRKQLDQLLDDDALYRQVRADFGQRHRSTLVHGRHSTPGEGLWRLLLSKHLHPWSSHDPQEQVDQNLLLRWFCRLDWGPVPDDTPLIRWATTLQPQTLHALTDRVVQLAVPAKVTTGRKLRLDATCVPTSLHHPPDRGLVVERVGVLSRLVQRAKGLVLSQGSNVQPLCRSRLRTARQVAQTLQRQVRRKGEDKEAQQKDLSQKRLQSAEQMGQHRRQVVARVGQPTQQQAHRLLKQAKPLLPLLERVIPQTRSRVLEGQQGASAEQVLSLFEPHTRAIPRNIGGALVEGGRQVILAEVEGGIVTRSAILEHPNEHGQALEAVAHHQTLCEHRPNLLAGDRGVHSAETESRRSAAGVKRVAIPAAGPISQDRQAWERTRGFRRG